MLNKSVKWTMTTLLALLLLLSACSSSTTPAPTNTEKKPAETKPGATTETKVELAPYEVTLAFNGPEQKDLPLIEAEISKITKERFNATVKLKRIEPAAWTQQKVLMFSGNEAIDIIFTGEYQYISEVAQNKLVALDDLLPLHGQGILEAFDEEVLAAAKIDGKTYAIPTGRDLAAYPSFLMHKGIADQLGIDASQIKTLADVEGVLRTVKEKRPELNAIGKGSSGTSFAYSMLLPTLDPLGDNIGVLTDLNQLNVVNLYGSDEYKEFVTLMHKWYKEGLVPKDIATTTQSGRDYMKANIGFATTTKGKPGITSQLGGAIGIDIAEAQLAEGKMNTFTITNAMLAIAATSKDPERAMMFLNLLYSDSEVINLLHWGIEGKHYALTDNGTIDFPEGVTAATSGYNLRQGWMLGNQLKSHPWVTDSPDIWEKMGEFNSKATRSIALGFMYDPEPVKTELAAILNVIQQYAMGLETGTLDPEVNLPKFNDALKSAGIEKVIAEKQKQLDEWAANK